MRSRRRREEALVFVIADEAGAGKTIHDGHFNVHENDVEFVFVFSVRAVFLVSPIDTVL
jgi:hypothetical protein